MATVIMTVRLKREILNNLDNLFRDRIGRAKITGDALVQNISEDIRKHFIPDEAVAVTKIPTFGNMFNYTNELQIMYTIGEGHFRNTLRYNYNMLPPRVYLHVKPEAEIYKKLVTCYEDYVMVTKEKQALLDKVAGYMDQCSTLKQLVSAWPSALDFVDTYTRERYHKKVTYTKKKVELNLDDEFKAGLLKARIINDADKSSPK